MSTAQPPSDSVREFPVSVLIERREVQSGPWREDQWEALAVVAGEDVVGDARTCTLVHQEEGKERYLWTGLKVELFKDGCESYWYNLLSDNPCLFVLCYRDEEEDDEALVPLLVTPNQDEANAHMETDDPVFSVPMPDQVHQWVERFVVENYVPEQKKKRKRKNWMDDAAKAQRAREAARRDH